MTVSRISDWVS